jgi:NADH-quinone oxidoreductase subunit E
MLVEKYAQEIQAILEKYPSDQRRAAVMPLLYLAQRDKMFVSREDMTEIGEILGISSTEVASIVGFYTLYYDQPQGKYRLQVCTDLPCALRGADKFMAELCSRLGIKPGGTTDDGLITIEPVMCLAACNRAPMFQLQSGAGLEYFEHQTVENALALIEQLRADAGRRKAAGGYVPAERMQGREGYGS